MALEAELALVRYPCGCIGLPLGPVEEAAGSRYRSRQPALIFESCQDDANGGGPGLGVDRPMWDNRPDGPNEGRGPEPLAGERAEAALHAVQKLVIMGRQARELVATLEGLRIMIRS
jgi:hypothetical protein